MTSVRTTEEFVREVLDSKVPVLVDFGATWCGPCQMLAPILKQVKESLGERITIIKIDVDQNPQVSTQYQIRSVPTLAIFKNGEIKWRQSGVFPANELERLIKENL